MNEGISGGIWEQVCECDMNVRSNKVACSVCEDEHECGLWEHVFEELGGNMYKCRCEQECESMCGL